MTVQEFLLKTWYAQEIAIVDTKIIFDVMLGVDDLKEVALFFGENYKTRSDLYKPIMKMEVVGYGVFDNVLVIEVK